MAAATGAKALVLPCGALDHTPMRSLDEDLDPVAAELIGAGQPGAGLGVELWTESLHFLPALLRTSSAPGTDRPPAGGSGVGIVMDFSHIVASGGDPLEFLDRCGDRIAHVHIRDAVPGNINLSSARPRRLRRRPQALAAAGYAGHFALELETRDVTNDERPAATAQPPASTDSPRFTA